MKPYYEDEHVALYHGDSREVCADLIFDAIVADPPYGVNLKGKSTKHTAASGVGYRSYEDTPENVSSVVVPLVDWLRSFEKPMVITPGLRNVFSYPKPDALGSIFYPSGAGNGRWGFTCSQPILYYGKDPYLTAGLGSRPDSFSSTEASMPNGHPCPKPIGTMRWLVLKASLVGQTVLDPFAGSGTTLCAAKDTGRRAIGVEIEERYCEIAATRLAQQAFDFGGVA